MKQQLAKFIPKSVYTNMIRFKYKNEIMSIHQDNFEQGYIFSIKLLNKVTRDKLDEILIKLCRGKISKFNIYFFPLAIIESRKGFNNYLELLNSNSRSKIKRSKKKGVEYKVFQWNDYLNDIFEIHTSSIKRQGRIMDEEYMSYPNKIYVPDEEEFKIRHLGAFFEGKLVGYIELYIYNNFCMTNRLLSHIKYQNKYIMNGLFAYCVEFSIENSIDYINYLTMLNKEKNALSAFKYRVGFRNFTLRDIT